MLIESGFFEEDAPGAARSSVPPDLARGRRIAEKYELLRKVGVGAMGEVWAARHLSLDEEVAIKLVIRDVQHEDGSTADGRFLVEARVARMLSRKTRHIVSVTDHGVDGEMAYLVMELLRGEPLDARLARSGPLPLEKVVPLTKQIARALAFAHADGIVHRDLKPGNVFLTLDEDGKPLIKILDFGIAKLRVDDGLRDPLANHGNVAGHRLSAQEAQQATLRGFLLGTPAYMSPEQARGKAIDHRVDVWALGVITYHLLTTHFPFDGANAEELFQRLVRVHAAPIAGHRPDLPPAIGELFVRAFAKKIDDRFPSAEAFAIALDRAAGKREDISFSLPPSAPVPSAATKAQSSIIAAGVPRKGKHGLAVGAVAALAALGVLALGYRHFAAPDIPSAPGLSAGGVTTEATSTTTLTRSDDAIPPPEPAPRLLVAPIATVAPVQAPPPVAPEPIATPVPATAPPPHPVKPVDRSEVF